MRIISGKARGRKLLSPPGRQQAIQSIRPTTDRAREALFSILANDIDSYSRVLDLFAGTGALGLEALSRGAAYTVFVDSDISAITLIKKNIAACGFSNSSRVIKRDLQKGLFFMKQAATVLATPVAEAVESNDAFDLVLIDPPYRQQLCPKILQELIKCQLLAPDAIVVCEEASSEKLPDMVEYLKLYDQRRYGDSAFWLYKVDVPI